MTLKQARDLQTRARCVELILDYGTETDVGHVFLKGIIESYVAHLLSADVDRFLALLTPKPASLGLESEGFKGRGNHVPH